jgi:hypothetical protein
MIKRRIILTGGGTAGHVTPHLALLPDEDAAVLEKIEAPGGPAKKKGRPAKDTEEAPGVTPAELAGAIRE